MTLNIKQRCHASYKPKKTPIDFIDSFISAHPSNGMRQNVQFHTDKWLYNKTFAKVGPDDFEAS